LSKHASTGLLTIHKATTLASLTSLPGGEQGEWELHLTRQASTPPRGGGEEEADSFRIRARSVVLATGGYSADRGEGGLLARWVPELRRVATTNGGFATGDGIKLAQAVGAGVIDMDIVQVHPTGFSDTPAGFKPSPGGNDPLILCAEILRGVGGVLLEASGARFTDELATRKAVTEAMKETGQDRFVIAVPPSAQKEVAAHMGIYAAKGLLRPASGAEGVAAFVHYRLPGGGLYGAASKAEVAARVRESFEATTAGKPPVRAKRTVLPLQGEYMVGVVQPVLHYSMGGLTVGLDANVLRKGDGRKIPGLYASGEIIGGTHGVNRLGGSSLLDCVVFGIKAADAATRRAGKRPGAGRKPGEQGRSGEKQGKKQGEPSSADGHTPTVVKIGDKHFDVGGTHRPHILPSIHPDSFDALCPRNPLVTPLCGPLQRSWTSTPAVPLM